MIRAAKFCDIPRLVALVQEMYARSKYAGRATLDLQATKGLLMNSLQRHGAPGYAGTWVLVAEHEGVIQGFIIGFLDRVYSLGVELMATDLLFYVSELGDVKDASGLLDGVIAWAKANPRVIEMDFRVTDAISDPERTAVLFKRRGFKQSGTSWEIAIEREAIRSVA